MYPMRSVKLAVASIALLLTACAPAALAQTPSTTTVAAPTDAKVAMVDANDATAPVVPATAPVAQAATEVPLAATVNTASSDLAAPAIAETNAPALADAAQAQSQAPAYENLNSPVDLLASYYNAINRKEYQRAYGYWQTPPMSFQKFANGFSDTTSAQLIVQPPTFIEGAAGSLYTSVPTVLVAKHTDGSTHTYAGCFVTRKSNIQADVWHIYSAQLKEVPNNTSIPNQLAQACPS